MGVEGHVGPLSLGLLGSNYRVNGVRVYGEVSVGWGAEEAGMEPDDECLWFNVDHRCSSQPSDGGRSCREPCSGLGGRDAGLDMTWLLF